MVQFVQIQSIVNPNPPLDPYLVDCCLLSVHVTFIMKAVRNTDSSRVVATGNATAKRVFKRRINPLSPPTSLELRGVRVHFPFKPYPCQETYMQTVLDALLRSENALLESPTGTGKTLCLLCATLAWQRQQAHMLRQASELNATSATTATTSGPSLCSQPPPEENASSSSSSLLRPPDDNTNSHIPPRAPVIIYASRTHSQLSQVVRELRTTRYRPAHAVLGSREQTCVHPKVQKPGATASDINHDCNKLGKERKCRFRNNLEGFTAPSNEEGCGGSTHNNNNHTQPVMDMEDLVAMGKSHAVCPFYYTRAQVENAELVLVPYNYLFDKDARETTLADIPWNNAVVIFDEAHNLESFASESASFDLSNIDVAGCVTEVTKAMNYVQAMPDVQGNLKLDNLIKLKAIFLKLEQFILNLGHQTAYNGEYMFDIFQQGCGINHANHEIFIDEVRKVNDLIMDLRGGGASRGSPRLEHFVQCLKRVFGYALESRCLAKAAFYRVHVSPPPSAIPNGSMTGRTVSYWCFAPALAMEELANLNVRSIIVTSGTLSPLPSYSMELGLNFPHTLENPHIISTHQIHVRVIGKGVSGKLLNSSYERRKDKDYYAELGNTLVSLAKVTPAGMLIFFPSYSVMESCVEEWGGPGTSRSIFAAKNNFFAKKRKPTSKTQYSFPFAPVHFATDQSGRTTPWQRLMSTKSVVVEPKSSADLQEALSEFRKFLRLPKSPGCILMGVCRGKISEGIDFANEESRAVVITGLPFPPSHDAKVKMKRDFLDGARSRSKTKASDDAGFQQNTSKLAASDRLSGHEWYTQQAHRAVNQAIGRVIRNQADYGAVLLLDSRFDQPQNQAGLSKWLRPHFRKDEGFGTAFRSLADFYKTAKSYAKAKEEENKKAAEAAILVYEDDGVLVKEDELPSKVALIRRSTNVNLGTTAEVDDTSAYVAPNDVVARIDVNDLLRRQGYSDKKPAPIITSKTPSLVTNDAVFGSKPMRVGKENSSNLAVLFMEKIKEKLSPSDQSTIRKAIVAMKGAGDKGDIQTYIKSASAIIDLVNRCEIFEAQTNTTDTSMLFLFFGLLPKQYRKQVEIMSFMLVFDGSSLGALFKENLEESEQTFFRSSMGSLLQSLWCRTSDVPLPIEVYLRESRFVLEKMYSATVTSSSSILAAYLKLIPESFRIPTRAWAAEKVASSNIQRLKDADRKRVGEESVKRARFQNAAMIKVESLLAFRPGTKNPTGAVGVPLELVPTKATQLKRKLDEPFAVPRVKQTANPYAKKKSEMNFASTDPQKPTKMKAVASTNPQKPAPVRELSVAGYIKNVEAEIYVEPSFGQIAKNIKTNAPRDLTCPVCQNACKEPFLAECGHMACLSCWLGWLNRSKSCMTCRVKTTKDSLARVVYEGKAGSGAPPTLSQLLVEDDCDDELEIC